MVGSSALILFSVLRFAAPVSSCRYSHLADISNLVQTFRLAACSRDESRCVEVLFRGWYPNAESHILTKAYPPRTVDLPSPQPSTICSPFIGALSQRVPQ